jgi:tetratricopeptide (TPR) repeat protein
LRQLLAATENTVSIARAKVLLDAVQVERALPDYAQALAYAHASQTLSDVLGNARSSNDARRRIASIMALQGDFAGSTALLHACLAEAERLEYDHGIENALSALALNHFDLQENEAAGQLFERCLVMARERGDALNVADALHHLALVMDAQGDAAGSIPMYEEVEATYRSLGYRRSMALVQNNMGIALMSLGQYDRARRLFVEGLLVRREMGLRLGYVYSFVNFGILAALEGKPVRAAHLLAAAEALSDLIGFSFATMVDDMYLAAIASVQVALGEARFRLEWSRGRGLDAEQAIELALHE